MTFEYNKSKTYVYIFAWVFTFLGSFIFAAFTLAFALKSEIEPFIVCLVFTLLGIYVGFEIFKAWNAQDGKIVVEQGVIRWEKSKEIIEIELNCIERIQYPSCTPFFTFIGKEGKTLLKIPDGYNKTSGIRNFLKNAIRDRL